LQRTSDEWLIVHVTLSDSLIRLLLQVTIAGGLVVGGRKKKISTFDAI